MQNSRRLEIATDALSFGETQGPLARTESRRFAYGRSSETMRSPRLAAARAAEAQAASHRETTADKERRIEELEERARLYGDSVKQSAVANALEKKWLRFLLVHGVK